MHTSLSQAASVPAGTLPGPSAAGADAASSHDEDWMDSRPAEAAAVATRRDPYPFTKDPWWQKALILTFVVLPLVAVVYAIATFWGRGVTGLDLGLMLGGWIISGLGISVGFHRMLTHRALDARAPTRAALLVVGSMAMQGAPNEWAATHLRHHAKADREGDPHSPLDGLWHSHTGWLLKDRFVRSGPAVDRLNEDPIVYWVSKLNVLWMVLGFLIPGLIGALVTGLTVGAGAAWGGFWGGVLWGGLVRVFLMHHITWSVNSVGHFFGTRPFQTTDQSRNNVVVAVLGFGEGWHNNHHAFPRAAYIGLKWWQFDPGRYLIVVLRWIGQIRSIWLPSRAEMRARRKVRKAAA